MVSVFALVFSLLQGWLVHLIIYFNQARCLRLLYCSSYLYLVTILLIPIQQFFQMSFIDWYWSACYLFHGLYVLFRLTVCRIIIVLLWLMLSTDPKFIVFTIVLEPGNINLSLKLILPLGGGDLVAVDHVLHMLIVDLLLINHCSSLILCSFTKDKWIASCNRFCL
jgi:hypothetical protein